MPSVEGFDIVRGAVTTFITTQADGPFHCENVAALYDVAAVDLMNRDIAGGDEATYSPAPVGTRVAVTVIVFGDFDLSSVEVDPSSARSQLITNVKHLVTDVVAPVDTGDGVATLNLYGVGGSSEGSAAVQFVGGLKPVPINPHSCAVTFDMYFPATVGRTGVIVS